MLSHTQEAVRWGMSTFVPRKEDVTFATAAKKWPLFFSRATGIQFCYSYFETQSLE